MCSSPSYCTYSFYACSAFDQLHFERAVRTLHLPLFRLLRLLGSSGVREDRRPTAGPGSSHLLMPRPLCATPLIAIIKLPRVVAEEVTNPLIVFYRCYYLVLCLLSLHCHCFLLCLALLTVNITVFTLMLFLVVARLWFDGRFLLSLCFCRPSTYSLCSNIPPDLSPAPPSCLPLSIHEECSLVLVPLVDNWNRFLLVIYCKEYNRPCMFINLVFHRFLRERYFEWWFRSTRGRWPPLALAQAFDRAPSAAVCGVLDHCGHFGAISGDSPLCTRRTCR